MKINPIIQEDEEYFCSNCNKPILYVEPNEYGKCPDCGGFIEIKLEINDFYHSCQRVNPSELSIGESITLELDFIHQILNIENHSSYYRVALKKYTTINIEKDSVITRIKGAWCK